MNKLVCALLATTAFGCASLPSGRPVTMVLDNGDIRSGSLSYDSPYSGVLTFPGSENQESFTGRYTVVDKTAIKTSSGAVIISGASTVPSFGSTSTTDSKEVRAEGYWASVGDKGTKIHCILEVGRQGHASGACTTSNSNTYQISL